MGEIKQDSRRSSVSCCVVKPPFCTLSTSPLGLVSSIPDPAVSIFAIMDPDEGKI